MKKNEPHQLIPIADRTNFSGTISVTLAFEMEQSDVDDIHSEFTKTTGYKVAYIPSRFSLTRKLTFDSSEKKSENSSYDLQNTYQKTKKRQAAPDSAELWKTLRAAIQSRLPALLYVPNFLFELPGTIPLKPAEDLDKARDSFFHGLLDGLLKLTDSSLSFEASLVQRASRANAQMEQAFRATTTRLEYALNQRVLHHWESIGGKKLQGLVLSLGTEDIDGVPCLTISLKQAGNEYRIEDRSLGFRWFFAFLMLTFYASGAGSRRQTVFLLDEPASNLHAAAQMKLLQSLKSLSNSLFVYSTHSHYLLAPELLPNTYVARNLGYDPDKDDEFVAQDTDVKATLFRQFVSKYPDQTEHFRVALDVLDVPITSLEFSLPCVFVEGKSDWYYMRLFQLHGHFDGLKFYPFGGVNSIDARVSQAVASAKPFVIVTDGDTEIIKKLTETYGEIVARSCVCLGAVLGKKKKGEDLFSADDSLMLIKASGLTGSSKAKVQRAAELCVAAGVQVEFDADSKANAKKVESAIRSVLGN